MSFVSHSVDALVEESGCSLENLATTKFRMCVLAGNWKQASHMYTSSLLFFHGGFFTIFE